MEGGLSLSNNKYSNTFEQIEESLSDSSDSIKLSDDNLVNQSNIDDEIFQYKQRDKLYTKLLQEYLNSYKSKMQCKQKMKTIFFYITIGAFILIIGLFLFVLGKASWEGLSSNADIVTVLGSVAGVLSALIAIPKIIAVHLFPTDEETSHVLMIRNMQKNDSRIRDVKSKKSNSK